MIELPLLARADVEAKLAELYRVERRHHLVAFLGAGEAELLDVAHAGRFEVVPVRSELELRAALPPLADDDRRMAFLLGWNALRVPLDLAGRFACGGRVLSIGRDERLKRLFGVSELDDAVRGCPLAKYLLRPGGEGRYGTTGGRLTLEALWAEWLRASWQVDVAGGLALDTLLAFAARNGRGAEFREAMGAPEAEGVREALLSHLREKLGAAGPAVWQAWEAGRGAVPLELAVVLATLGPSARPEVQLWVRSTLRATLGIASEKEAAEAARALGRAASAGLRALEAGDGGQRARALIVAADARLDDAVIREAASGSELLPSAWRARLEALGRRLEESAGSPSVAAVRAAVEGLRSLEAHLFFSDREQRAELGRAEMAVRLLGWLAVRAGQRLEAGATPQSEAEALGRWYAEEGGYVDRARRWARGATDTPLGRGVEAVVAAADAARTELDRRFARSLVSWIEADGPAQQVLPIDRAVARLAVRFLDERPERRLLVLLLDGMAWAQAVELLESLGHRAAPWGPLAWHASRHGRHGEGLYPVVFAALPTVTEVSRAAFFAGKPVVPGQGLDSQQDPVRWRAHREVLKYFSGPDAPPLLLRSEGHTRAGGASPEALNLVADPDRRVVALVVNAIDDALRGNPGHRVAWEVESIASLPDLLERAREHGRSVLLASDHGHVPADRLVSVGPRSATGGARWRAWAGPEEVLGESEVAFALRGERIWAPKGARGVVLLADDASRYGGSTHAGEHGGATLAEVVVPCLLLGCDDGLGTGGDDPALAVRAAHVPGWWCFDVREPVDVPGEASGEVPATPPPTRRTKSTVSEAQLPLLDVPAVSVAAQPGPVPLGADGGVESPLASSAVLKARAPAGKVRDEVLRAATFLLERKGTCSADAFAAGLTIPRFRVEGFIAVLQEVLNVDGYEVLKYDPKAREVKLDPEKLRQLFEVAL
ncbi:MAG: BREX-2 system phosphatase PglZ [Deltaproteobacteria bacterium]|nr:BREX-2 system phosphatase PglZ [Deltaproteobacteria bacterium]